MTALIKAHDADRILFGTDSPWPDQEAEIAGVRALEPSQDEFAAILGGNAEKVLV